MEQKKTFNVRGEIYSWVQALAMALVIFVLLFTLFFRIIGVDGDSMNPTLEDGERLLVSNLFYKPSRGDVVIFTIKGLRFDGYPQQDLALVKRVIAVGGDELEINFNSGEVRINGELQDEKYIAASTLTQEDMPTYMQVTVPEGKLFVMGDNRNRSTDSRDQRIGFVDERCILGHVLVRLFPLNQISKIE